VPRLRVDADVARWLKQAVERSQGQAEDENQVLRILLGLDEMPPDPEEEPQATMALGELSDSTEFEFPPMHPWRQKARFFGPDHRLFEAETAALKQLGLLCGVLRGVNGGEGSVGDPCVLVDGHYPKTPHLFYKSNFLVHRAELMECLQEIMPPEQEVHH
jgi:hypothetical protein